MRAIVLSLAVLASCAAPAPAQTEPTSKFDTRITLAMNQATLAEALSRVAKESGLNIILNGGVDRRAICTFSVSDVPASEVVEAIAKTFGLKVVREKYDILRITS